MSKVNEQTAELLVVNADSKTVLAQYAVTPEKVEELVAPYRELTIAGVGDTKGYRAADDARKELKKTRIAIENKRKELKADALEFGRTVDNAAKQLSGPIIAVEEELERKQKAIDDEKARLKQQRLQDRLDRLAVIGCSHDVRLLDAMTDNEFEDLHAAKVKENEDRIAREAEEKERLRLEQENIAKEREELAKLQKEKAERDAAEAAEKQAEQQRIRQVIAGRQDRLKNIGVRVPDGLVSGLSDDEFEAYYVEQKTAAERKKEEEEKLEAERTRLAEIERHQNEERDKLEAERKRIELEEARKAAELQAEQEAEDRKKQEADRKRLEKKLQPDREKLMSLADAVKSIEAPEVSDAAKLALQNVMDVLITAEQQIRFIATNL